MNKNNFAITDLQYFKSCYPETVSFLEKYHNGKITTVLFNPLEVMYRMLFDSVDETYLSQISANRIETKKLCYDELSSNYKIYLKIIRDEKWI